MNTQDREDAVTLEILETIDSRSDVSQRHLAERLDVALGLTNLYLKRCIRKGLVKIKQAPANRYLYYLTPKGFSEKSRLTAKYLSISFDFYRRASESCAAALRACRADGHGRILLCGVSELAEIASLRAEEEGLEVVGTYDPSSARARFVGRPVWRKFSDVSEFDSCILTALDESGELYRDITARLGPGRIRVPNVLGRAHTLGAAGPRARSQAKQR